MFCICFESGCSVYESITGLPLVGRVGLKKADEGTGLVGSHCIIVYAGIALILVALHRLAPVKGYDMASEHLIPSNRSLLEKGGMD